MSTLSVVRPLDQLCLKRGRFVELSHEFMVEAERVFTAANKLDLLTAPVIISLYDCAAAVKPQAEETIINAINEELKKAPLSLKDTGEIGKKFNNIRVFLDYIWEQARFGYIRYIFKLMAKRLVDYDGYKQAKIDKELGRSVSAEKITPYRVVRTDDPNQFGRSEVYIDPAKSFTSQYPLAKPIEYESFKTYWMNASKYIKDKLYAEVDAPDPALANGDAKNLNWHKIHIKLDYHASNFASVCCLFDGLYYYVDQATDKPRANQVVQKVMEKVYNRHKDLGYEKMFWNFTDAIEQDMQPLGMFDIEIDYRGALAQLRGCGIPRDETSSNFYF